MQVDTLYLTPDELNTLYFDGAGQLSEESAATMRLFQTTVNDTEERFNRAAGAQMAGMPTGGEPVKMYKARIHVHFVVEPA